MKPRSSDANVSKKGVRLWNGTSTTRSSPHISCHVTVGHSWLGWTLFVRIADDGVEVRGQAFLEHSLADLVHEANATCGAWANYGSLVSLCIQDCLTNMLRKP